MKVFINKESKYMSKLEYCQYLFIGANDEDRGAHGIICNICIKKSEMIERGYQIKEVSQQEFNEYYFADKPFLYEPQMSFF